MPPPPFRHGPPRPGGPGQPVTSKRYSLIRIRSRGSRPGLRPGAPSGGSPEDLPGSLMAGWSGGATSRARSSGGGQGQERGTSPADGSMPSGGLPAQGPRGETGRIRGQRAEPLVDRAPARDSEDSRHSSPRQVGTLPGGLNFRQVFTRRRRWRAVIRRGSVVRGYGYSNKATSFLEC